MAVFLKRTHELFALKATMLVKERPHVLLELESNKGGVPKTEAQWTILASEMGLPRRLESRGMPKFRLADDMMGELKQRLDGFNLPPTHPLWLHLVKPYGYLGVVPWESLLVPVIERPILRLPDFLERPRENRTALDVAVCCSAPLSEPAFSVPDVITEMVGAILGGSPREYTRVHIFTDAEASDALSGRFTGEPRVSVHDPAPVAAYGEPNPSAPAEGRDDVRSVRCWWLRWIRDAMKSRSLDTVHFVCHGYLADDRPALALAESPLRNRDRRAAHFVLVGELAAFLTQTGAWSVSFTEVPNNYSEAGLRLMADTIAQTRPGPVLYHGRCVDGGVGALRDAYQFLFAPQASEPHLDPACFVYCQPALVASQEPVAVQAAVPAVDLNARLFMPKAATPAPPAPPPAVGKRRRRQSEEPAASAEPAGATPNWLAAAQRYVEGAALDIQRREVNMARPSSRASESANEAAQKTLADLQKVVADFARKSRPDLS